MAAPSKHISEASPRKSAAKMSNATQAIDAQDNSSGGHSKYGILLYIVILAVVTVITIVSIVVARLRHGALLGGPWRVEGYDDDDSEDEGGSSQHGPMGDVEKGIDDATLESYPKFVCSDPREFSTRCSICLGAYTDVEMLRLLPKCGHKFHQKCIDPWLKMHSTCPVCRSCSSLNSPEEKQKSAVEVAPLAAQES